MLERDIYRSDVVDALKNGIIIETYEDDKPFASFLLASVKGVLPLHVVYSIDKAEKTLYIITAYRPDRVHFMDDLLTRRDDEQ